MALSLAAALLAAEARGLPRLVVDTERVVAPVRREVFGGNLEYITAPSPEARRLTEALPLLRFPGGDADADFLWDRETPSPCGRRGTDWPLAAELAARGGAALFLESNLPRGTPRGFAAWVADARSRGLRVPWVQVGNEVWGSWDRGFRSPAQYARDVRAHALALRALGPMPAFALPVGTAEEEPWNREALRLTADMVGALDYHFYPNHHERPRVRPEEVIAGAEAIAPLLARLRAMVREVAPARQGAIGVLIGEWDGAADPPPRSQAAALPAGVPYAQWSMANALFYGAALGEFLLGGVLGATFYEVQGYRFGALPGDRCMPSDGRVLRPKVLALELWLNHTGQHMVSTNMVDVPSYMVDGPTDWDGYAGPVPYVRAYASVSEDRQGLYLMVVQRGPRSVAPALEVELRGFDPEPVAREWAVAGASPWDTNENVGGPPEAVRVQEGEVRVPGRRFLYGLRPWSVTALELRRARPRRAP